MSYIYARLRLFNRFLACSANASLSFVNLSKVGIAVLPKISCCHRQQLSKRELCSSSASETVDDATDVWLQQILDNVVKIQVNVRARNLKIDVKHLVTQIENLKQLQQQKLYLENQRRENAHLMKLIVKSKNVQDSQQEKGKLIKRGQEVRRKLKQLMEEKYNTAYSEVMRDVLQLPTDLHSSTTEEDQVLLEFGSKKDYNGDVNNHLVLTKDKSVFRVSLVSDHSYYMTGNLAISEHRLMNGISDYLRMKGFEQLAGPDMVKGVIADGCGVKEHQVFSIANPNAANEFDTKAQNFVLSGVSCLVFSAYLSSLAVEEKMLPLKYFAVGCGYSRDETATNDRGLYDVSQMSKADIFGAGRSIQEADELFDNMLNVIIDIYRLLDLPTRFVQVAANKLELMEARRVDVLIWSEGFHEYIKCGELRLCNDFISRRLGITCQSSSSTESFLYSVHGVVVKIPSILACIVERYQTADISDIHHNLKITDRTKI